MRIALHLYVNQMRGVITSQQTMDVLIHSFKRTTKFHEMKLFFIHQHFSLMSIE